MPDTTITRKTIDAWWADHAKVGSLLVNTENTYLARGPANDGKPLEVMSITAGFLRLRPADPGDPEMVPPWRLTKPKTVRAVVALTDDLIRYEIAGRPGHFSTWKVAS